MYSLPRRAYVVTLQPDQVNAKKSQPLSLPLHCRFLVTKGRVTEFGRHHEGKNPEYILGDGQTAWQALEEKYDAISNDAR